ncbi:MAG: Holliday junction branch migration protein RuvA [Elusimicrobiota bacterium]
MIASLRGAVLSKNGGRIVLEAGGVGYEILVTAPTSDILPKEGESAFLLIEESFALYGGGQNLYGFLSQAEKDLFLTFKNEVPSTGAKKALEYLERASKSLPDFRRAVLEKDSKLLCAVFGFTKKTAEKIIAALKDTMEKANFPGKGKISRADVGTAGSLSQAINALSSLGYRQSEARAAIESVTSESRGRDIPIEELVRLALKKL